MNIAFPALLIFLLILPGLIFNGAFYNIENTPLTYIPFTNKTILSSIATLILHGLGLGVIVSVLHHPLNLPLWLILISGGQGQAYSLAVASVTTQQLFFSVIYLLMIYLLAYLCGKGLRGLISYFEWDRYPIFEIDSSWYYLFKGYDWEDGTPDGVQIAATIEMGGQCFLYVGILEKFFLNSLGNIDRLILTSAMRRPIEKDKNHKTLSEEEFSQRFYSIDGDYFVLRYSEVKNLNVQFIKIEEISQ